MDFITAHGLDIFTTILGLVYIWLEYRASILLWIVGIIMPALDIWLYASHGLYGDAGMAGYYTVAAIYGYAIWKFGKKHGQKKDEVLPITHMRKQLLIPTGIFFLVSWAAIYWILKEYTDSNLCKSIIWKMVSFLKIKANFLPDFILFPYLCLPKFNGLKIRKNG